MSHIKQWFCNRYWVPYQFHCVLEITGFIFRLSTQGKAEERLNKFAVSEMGSLLWFNNNTILKSVY
jgi:hypothetical protein